MGALISLSLISSKATWVHLFHSNVLALSISVMGDTIKLKSLINLQENEAMKASNLLNKGRSRPFMNGLNLALICMNGLG